MSLVAHISHRFDGFELDAELKMKAGVTALSGPSGAGKTTIIRAIAGLFAPEKAHIEVDGQVLTDTDRSTFVPPHKRRIGLVFQDARLFPHLSVEKNLLYGQRFSARKREVAPIADMLGISELLQRRPGSLSGGETQRVALGRALLSDPQLLLMDEPLAALDDERKAVILPYLERIRSEGGPPILYVSHAMDEILRLADNIVLLRNGRTVRSGELSEILSDPAAVPDLGPRAAGALLKARLVKRDAGDGVSELETSAGKLYLPIRPEQEGAMMRVRISASDVMLSRDRPDKISALNILKAEITSIHEGQGPGVAVALTSGSDRLLARITRRSAKLMGLRAGMSCYAVIKSVSVAPGDILTDRNTTI